MLKKLNYRPVIEYGVLTGIKRNSIVLEKEGETVTGYETAKELQDHIKANKLPARIGPIYQHIKDPEEMKRYIRDAKMDGQIDLRKSLEDMRASVVKVMEPEREVTDEKLVIESDSRLLS